MKSHKLLSVQRTADLLCVTPKRVYRMIQEGQLASLRIGYRTIRITEESLDDYISQRLDHEKAELGLDMPLTKTRRRRAC